jgi:hypothetical protein
MAITRPHVCEYLLATAEADDHGNVTIAVANGTPFTPEEAREFAAEISAAADAAVAYRAEQNAEDPR